MLGPANFDKRGEMVKNNTFSEALSAARLHLHGRSPWSTPFSALILRHGDWTDTGQFHGEVYAHLRGIDKWDSSQQRRPLAFPGTTLLHESSRVNAVDPMMSGKLTPLAANVAFSASQQENSNHPRVDLVRLAHPVHRVPGQTDPLHHSANAR